MLFDNGSKAMTKEEVQASEDVNGHAGFVCPSVNGHDENAVTPMKGEVVKPETPAPVKADKTEGVHLEMHMN